LNAPKVSAGLLMFRRKGTQIEVLLVHPGGPFFAKKDRGAWSLPKGEMEPGEEPLARARIEFEEELGVGASGAFVELGSVKQKGGKVVHAWAFEGDLPVDFRLRSNTFDLEWPPRSGRIAKFPEVDRAEFFPTDRAREFINEAQAAFLDRLLEILKS
jgi:predicted NUDIX family NTP pyrophosphohydrolase